MRKIVAVYIRGDALMRNIYDRLNAFVRRGVLTDVEAPIGFDDAFDARNGLLVSLERWVQSHGRIEFLELVAHGDRHWSGCLGACDYMRVVTRLQPLLSQDAVVVLDSCLSGGVKTRPPACIAQSIKLALGCRVFGAKGFLNSGTIVEGTHAPICTVPRRIRRPQGSASGRCIEQGWACFDEFCRVPGPIVYACRVRIDDSKTFSRRDRETLIRHLTRVTKEPPVGVAGAFLPEAVDLFIELGGREYKLAYGFELLQESQSHRVWEVALPSSLREKLAAELEPVHSGESYRIEVSGPVGRHREYFASAESFGRLAGTRSRNPRHARELAIAEVEDLQRAMRRKGHRVPQPFDGPIDCRIESSEQAPRTHHGKIHRL